MQAIYDLILEISDWIKAIACGGGCLLSLVALFLYAIASVVRDIRDDVRKARSEANAREANAE